MSTAAEPFPEPHTYTRTKLADLVEFRRGLTYKKKDEVDQSSNAVLRANNIDLASGQLDLSGIRYIDDAINVPASKKLEAGSVLLCTASGSRSHLGKAAYIDTAIDCAFGGFMGLLVPSSRLNGKFLHYFTRSDAYWQFLDGLAGGTNINNLKFKDLGELAIPLPELEEQKRIVAVLDQAFAALDRARSHCESNIQSAINLFRGFLESVLSRDIEEWDQRPLKALGDIQTGSTPKSSNKENFGDFVPFVKPGNFNADGSLTIGTNGLSEEGAQKARLISAGSAMMVCIGATIGKAGFNDQQIATNQQINSLSPNDSVLGEFLYYQFITERFQKQVRQHAGQATLPIVNKSKWSNLLVPIPPDVDTQLGIVEKLRRMRSHSDCLIEKYEAKLNALTNLRAALLRQAFAGEVT